MEVRVVERLMGRAGESSARLARFFELTERFSAAEDARLPRGDALLLTGLGAKEPIVLLRFKPPGEGDELLPIPPVVEEIRLSTRRGRAIGIPVGVRGATPITDALLAASCFGVKSSSASELRVRPA